MRDVSAILTPSPSPSATHGTEPSARHRRVLAVNLNYLGDALFTTPALQSLRARFPGAQIDVLCGPRAATVLRGNPHVDRVIERPQARGAGRSVFLWQTLRAGKRYDAVVLFHGTFTSALLTFLSGAPVRVGFEGENKTRLLTHAVARRGADEHVVDAYLRLPLALGSAPADTAAGAPRLFLPIAPDDRAFAARFLGEAAASGDTGANGSEATDRTPTVGLVIGTTRPQKCWPEAHFARLAERLWNRSGLVCVLLGGPGEEDRARRIQEMAANVPLVSAVGRTTEMQMAALLSQMRAVVSGDTGPLHFAAAVQTPLVALFGSTDPRETGPWIAPGSHGKAVTLYDNLPCAPCGKHPTCDGRFDCLRNLTPERVYDAVLSLLDLPNGRTPLPVISPAREGANR